MGLSNPHRNIPLLEAFALGTVARPTADTVAQHLETCADCRGVVARTPADPFLTDLREAVSARAEASALKPPLGIWATVVRLAAPVPARVTRNPIPPALIDSAEYEVIRDLGQGGMGVVYLVRNRGLDRLEGLKVVRPSQLDHPGALERFEREMRAAARLDHPNIVKAHHSPRLEGLLAFAMEFVDGTDLQKYVDDHGLLPISNACYYVSQVARGLQHAHENGTVHRDIKPKNLILTRDGKKQVVKILDFGLAKAASENSTDGSLTGTGDILGTPDYIAPEQIGSAATADIRADIYSLGCTLYFLLTGQPPFAGKQTAYAKMQAHSTENARPLTELRADVPVELAETVARMMARSPAQRFQTPVEVAAALAPFFKAGIKPIRTGTTSSPAPKAATSETACSKETASEQPHAPAPVPPPIAEPADQPGIPSDRDRIAAMPAVVPDIRGPLSGARRVRQPALGLLMRLRSPKVLIGLAAGLLAVGCLVAGAGGVFRVQTEDGILVIETNVDNPDVFVNGNRVTVKWDDGAKQAEVGVRPGERLVEVRKEGYRVAARELKFKDGKRTIFEARLEPLPAVAQATELMVDGRQAGDERDDNSLSLKLVWCPPGTFTMGSPASEVGRQSDEDQVSVTLTTGFWLAKYEVTQAQYQQIMGTNPSRFKGPQSAQYPIENVSWDDAREFCRKFTEQERAAGLLPPSWEYTLPTEAQWEYACRAGSTTPFSFGTSLNRDQANTKGTYLERTTTIGSYIKNAWGLYDMHGNVYEWCLDASERKLPGESDPVSVRVCRGGGWNDWAGDCRSAHRIWCSPWFRSIGNLGFRLAASSIQIHDAGPGSESTIVIAESPVPTAEGNRAGDERDDNALKLKLDWCPPSTFTMGSPAGEGQRDDNEAQVRVRLADGFWLGKYEVTQEQYEQVTGTNPSIFQGPQTAQYPVEHVSWDEAREFCRKFSDQERNAGRLPAGWEYTLPTEAQWEYACRAGTTTPFSFGTSLNGDQANCNGNEPYGTSTTGTYLQWTTSIGLYAKNAWGLYDMHGNVWEWCLDAFGHRLPGGTNPVVSEGWERVHRGGSWDRAAVFCRSAHRGRTSPDNRYASVGFRLALSPIQ